MDSLITFGADSFSIETPALRSFEEKKKKKKTRKKKKKGKRERKKVVFICKAALPLLRLRSEFLSSPNINTGLNCKKKLLKKLKNYYRVLRSSRNYNREGSGSESVMDSVIEIKGENQ